ncbi:DUF1127 domain-containing protein [Azospirillum rugosum]|uniref:Uncharacterized protein YjiS (DUF1127 family) n=1 Tax=Azospirillum rugosum TaxID=416170 RepID=A0ABS4SEE2_9PROT|nr:DUF1127 domain-containing protein [Azospirillum rugosum]MBP2290938.1 uncharacterized protein YjiS (DUF1127 family) [Azospirillum rugosum]MDQ0524998.1 uncharacterized protein YjiS (DUF1127 family) [Azospirillum rugosum]
MRSTEATRSTGSSTTATPVIARVLAVGVRPLWMAVEHAFGAYERWRQRQALGRLDDHLLKDIGLSRADVDAETRKPFWKE